MCRLCVLLLLSIGCIRITGETRQVEVFTPSAPPLSQILTRRLHCYISDVSATSRQYWGWCKFCQTVEQPCRGLHCVIIRCVVRHSLVMTHMPSNISTVSVCCINLRLRLETYWVQCTMTTVLYCCTSCCWLVTSFSQVYDFNALMLLVSHQGGHLLWTFEGQCAKPDKSVNGR